MICERHTARNLYKKLLTLYPRTFREWLGESMDQTFQDLWNEKRQTKKELFGFLLWTFIETAIGIFREHLLLISPGDIMQTTLKTLGSSAFISFLLLLPFMTMEVVNRRTFNENFPIALFFAMWMNLFAISLMLLPIVRSRWAGKRDIENPVPIPSNNLLTNPKSATMISIGIILSLLTVSLLDSLGWISLEQLVNSSSAEKFYIFGFNVMGRFLLFLLISLPIVAGIIASGPIIRTLQTGGSLFAHPINLIIVAFIVFPLVLGFANFVIDQWPCFIGVPNCD